MNDVDDENDDCGSAVRIVGTVVVVVVVVVVAVTVVVVAVEVVEAVAEQAAAAVEVHRSFDVTIESENDVAIVVYREM